MTPLPWGHKDWVQKKPVLNFQTPRDEQLYLIHAIMHCCVDAGDNRITEFDTAQIVCRHYDYSLSPAAIAKSSVFKNLANPEHKLCQMVAHFINERRHKTFFEAKAHFLYDKYLGIGVLRFPTNIEGELVGLSSIDGEEDMLTMAIEFLQSLFKQQPENWHNYQWESPQVQARPERQIHPSALKIYLVNILT